MKQKIGTFLIRNTAERIIWILAFLETDSQALIFRSIFVLPQ